MIKKEVNGLDSSILFLLLIQVVLIALNAVFASAEIAVISMNDTKLERMAEGGDKRAARLVKLTSQPAKFLATIQVAITLSGFLGSAFAADNFSDLLVNGLIGLGLTIPRSTLDTIAVILITLILSYFTLIFGELVPKRVAMRKAEGMALGISGVISGISKIFAPIVWFLTVSTNAVLRIMGIDPNEEDEEVGEEEIRMMVDASSEKGKIALQEKELIQNIFEFDDLTVGEIAIHRTEVNALWMKDTAEEWDEIIREGVHTLYPVYGETADQVIGILNAKKYFKLKSCDRNRVMECAIEPPYFIPEKVKADVLFKNMKQTHQFFAVVLDEYGGVTGIVTMTDLIEELVGDFEPEVSSEYENPEIIEVQMNGNSSWNIRGTASLEDVEETLGMVFKEEEYETFGGYVFGVLGEVPKDGTKVAIETDGLNIQIEEIKNHQLIRAIVAKANSSRISEK